MNIMTSTFRLWFLVALADLLAAAVIGVLLRGMFLWEIPFVRFRPWLHGHSHVAMLGWLFIGVVVALLHDGGKRGLTRTTRALLLGLQAAVVVMLFSFPAQGYGPVSIASSSVHMVLAYIITGSLWRASRAWPAAGSGRLVRWAVVFFVLSTLGVLGIGPIIALGHQGKEVYYWAVQFFLHFQFNGWLWFAAMALGVRWAERQGFDLRLDRLTLALWVVSAILTYALAIAWSEPLPAVFATVSIGVLLQVWAALRTLRILRRLESRARDRFPAWTKVLIGVALVSMAMKVMVQAAVALPEIAVVGFTLRHYVMGFIHLNTLATMSTLLLAYALTQKWLGIHRTMVRTGLVLFIAGVLLSELLLFVQGTFFWAGLGLIPGHYWHLFLTSALMPSGIVCLLAGACRPEKREQAAR